MPRALTFRLSLILAGLVLAGFAQMSQAQTFTVIHNFTGYDDGSIHAPGALDRRGKLLRHHLRGRHSPAQLRYLLWHCVQAFREERRLDAEYPL